MVLIIEAAGLSNTEATKVIASMPHGHWVPLRCSSRKLQFPHRVRFNRGEHVLVPLPLSKTKHDRHEEAISSELAYRYSRTAKEFVFLHGIEEF